MVSGVGAAGQNGEVRRHASAGQHEENQGGGTVEKADDKGRHRATPVGAHVDAETAAAGGAERTLRTCGTAGRRNADPDSQHRLPQGARVILAIDEKNVLPKIKKTFKNVKNVTKINNVCKR